MNVYEAIAKSPVGVAWHNEKEILARNVVADVVRANPDGWQPLYTSDEVQQWKQRAEKAEAQLYAACKQLAGEYQLGEPLTEATKADRYVAVRKLDGIFRQGHFSYSGKVDNAYWDYYADPRPWPVLPEPKEEPKLFDNYGDDCHVLTDEGRRRLEKLLRKEGE